MIDYEILEKLEAEAKKYNEFEFRLFCDEIGWQDWMSDYVENDDDITEKEHAKIDKILKTAWENVHGY